MVPRLFNSVVFIDSFVFSFYDFRVLVVRGWLLCCFVYSLHCCADFVCVLIVGSCGMLV